MSLRLRPARPGWGEVLGFSFTGQIEQCTSRLRCFFQHCFIQEYLSDCYENLVSARSLARCTQSVDIFALALKMLAKYFVHKSCKERTCLVPLVCIAGSLSETLRLSSKSWNPELLYISRGQFIFSDNYLQPNYTAIQVIPILKPKRREKSTPLQLFIFLLYLLLYIMA